MSLRRVSIVVLATALALLGADAAFSQTCNARPVAVADTIASDPGTLWIDVTANDEEPDGEAVTVTVVNDFCGGTATVAMNAVRLVVPPGSQDCSLAYRLTDESGNTSQQTATVTVLFSSLFRDGFESGASDHWSSCAGC